MAKKLKTESAFAALWSFIAWLTGVIVSLAVGFGLTSGTLFIPWIPILITKTAGGIVVILTILGALMALIDKNMSN